ncbi:MAG: ABC transporter ATP-binding protein [Promethearchaeota archaeon]|nr:MAG: ABC transporter ATP-binding protein [Candidatus Lokiarchaeota archaeon]
MSKSELYSIEISNISKTYISGEIKVEALRNLNLKVQKGQRIVVLGPSGSGKTTLLNLLGGITSPDKDGDSLIIFGKDIKEYDQKDFTLYRRDKIGFIFQFFNLFPALNAIDNVIIGIDLLNKKLKKQLDTYKIAKEYLEKVGLGDRLYHYPSQLSGGEQQRVAIARALAKIPFVGKNFILLCDEPTGNLDTNTGEKILNLMKKMNEEIGITIVLVTHSLNIANMFATRIIRLKNGQLEK